MQKFSVSMCLYNGDNPAWFQTAVDSILNQTLQPSEIVLVIDGPINSDLENVVSNLQTNDLFKIIRLEKNEGHGVARRTGLKNCSYNIVAIMDADDISLQHRFEKQMSLLSHDETLSIVGGNITEFEGEPNHIVSKRLVPSDDKEIKAYLKKRCPMNLVTVMFKKDDIESVGGFVDWYCEEDYYLWVRMALNNLKFANIQDIVVNVRVGDKMFQRRGGLKYFMSEYRLQKYMYQHHVISWPIYFVNVLKRFVAEVVLTNRLREFAYKKFARD